MTRQDWDRLFELFHGSRERSGPDRDRYLRDRCGGDHSLIAAVEQLLLEDEDAGSFLSRPFSGLGRAAGPIVTANQRFGRYTTSSFVGRGGMGEVWRGYDPDLDRPVALKFLAAGFGLDQLTREARMASALNHPGIVTVHEVLAFERTPILVMEFVEGRPLSHVPVGPQHAARLIPLALQIADALAAAHAKGIIHGDLKPDNVLVRPDGFVKILDFGLARQATAENIATGGLLAGTLLYMSPEQARGEPLTAATDVFSLGLVLFELVTGRPAFGRSGLDAVQTMLRQPAPRASSVASSIAPEWDSLLEGMLRAEPATRLQMTEVAGRLRRMLNPAPSRTWIWMAAAAALALIAATAFWFFKSPRVNAPTLPEPQWVGRPLTSDPGDEVGATPSPDGSRIVYAWRPEEESFFSLFEKNIANGTRRRIVSGSTTNYGPSWSPDGQWIAYIQADGQTGVIAIVPASGGEPRQVVRLRQPPYHARRSLDWSADSQWIVYGEKDPASAKHCLFATSIRDGKTRKLAEPDGLSGLDEPIISPDGALLAFTQVRDGVTRLGIQRLAPGLTPQGRPWTLQLAGFETALCEGPMWRSNGAELMFLSNKGGPGGHLWTVEISGSEKQVQTPRMIGSLGDGVVAPAVSRAGSYLMFTRRTQDKNIWRVDLSRGERGQQVRLEASTQQEYFPQYAPDGRRIAFESDRSGFPEIWISDADGQNAFALTNFRGPVTGSPAWSPDGRQVAFDTRATGEPEVYTVAAEPGAAPRRVTFGDGDNVLPVWSPDGRFLYFNSNRKGDFQVWRVPAAGGPEEPVTDTFAFAPQVSPDGNFLYYSVSRYAHTTLRRLDLNSRREEIVTAKALDRSFFPTARGVVYIQGISASRVVIRFWDAATKTDSVVTHVRGSHAGGLSVSRDGRSALIVKDDSLGADLVMVPDFR